MLSLAPPVHVPTAAGSVCPLVVIPLEGLQHSNLPKLHLACWPGAESSFTVNGQSQRQPSAHSAAVVRQRAAVLHRLTLQPLPSRCACPGLRPVRAHHVTRSPPPCCRLHHADGHPSRLRSQAVRQLSWLLMPRNPAVVCARNYCHVPQTATMHSFIAPYWHTSNVQLRVWLAGLGDRAQASIGHGVRPGEAPFNKAGRHTPSKSAK